MNNVPTCRCTKLNFCLNVILGMLRKVTLELTVLDYDRIGGSDPIGKVRLGYSRKKLEKKHWAEMVENPRRPVIHWHVLQVYNSRMFYSQIYSLN